MEDDDVLLIFFSKIGRIRKSIDAIKLRLLESTDFKDIEVSCGFYTRGELHESEMSLGIDSSLDSILNGHLYSAGMSFRIFKRDGKWNFSGEVGWSSYDIGFDEVDSVDSSYVDIKSMLNNVEANFNQLMQKYEVLINSTKEKMKT